ncbi:MAG: phosphoribosyltransferase family protein [bacterium]|nr:phosphoribosyltransferase family protein [bacterium]
MKANKVTELGKKINTILIDLLFPPACVGCDNFGPWLCDDCLKNIGAPIDTCIFCNEKTLHGITCGDCHKHNNLAGIISVGGYKNPILRNAVHALKFSGVRDMAEPLGELLAKSILQTLGSDLNGFTIVPLPLHKKRERERGFNQSALLVSRVSSLLSLPTVNILVRQKSTTPQASLNSKMIDLRQENIADAFSINPEYSTTIPKKIIIIDDVATSGSTINEATKVLSEKGVKEIWGAVICRG